MGEWLVPISRHIRFAQTSGRTVEPHYAALRDAALSGKLARVDCEVRGPLVNLRAGDTVFCYTTELDVGVFAVGRARAATKAGRPVVSVRFEKARTKLFAADPLPAMTIRRWVPELRNGAVSLDLRPRALVVLDAWERERGERDVELLTPINVTPWRVAATKSSKGSLTAAQHDIAAPIARMFRSQDFAVGLGVPVGTEPRIVARRVRDVVVVDLCRARTGGGRAEALDAIGPLLLARWRLQREAFDDARLRATLWMAFASRPQEEVVTFLEDSELLVSWLQRSGIVELTDRSKQRWYQQLGVR